MPVNQKEKTILEIPTTLLATLKSLQENKLVNMSIFFDVAVKIISSKNEGYTEHSDSEVEIYLSDVKKLLVNIGEIKMLEQTSL